MRGDPPEATIRLSSRLPVVTHEQRDPDRRKLKRPTIYPPKKGPEGLPVRIAGVEYSSLKEARRKLKKGAKTLYNWLDTGMAEYV